eukprot:3654604-Rhodomonas_salina.1
MKGALTVLLLKKEPREELQNHRPVCLMQVVTKMITTIVTDSIVRQEGGRAAHSTKRQIQKLIWAIHRAEERGDRLTIAYIDWQNGNNSVDHEALFQILEGYWFTEPDIRLLRNLYDDSWFDVHTH